MFKKLISVTLCIVLLCTVAAPVASAVKEESYPIVYVTGYGPNIFAEKGNNQSEVYYPTGADVGAIVKEAIAPCLVELAGGMITGNYDKYCDELYNSIHPIYENLVLAPDGTPKDNSGREEDPNVVILDYTRFSGGEETFPYDWRLSPETSADELDAFIDTMLAATGAEKVNIIGRCLGGNVVSAYLEKYDDAPEKVSEIIMFIPSTEGINMIGALFSGQIEIDASKLDEYLEEYTKYEPFIEDPVIKDFVNVMVSILEQGKILGMGTDLLQDLIDEIKDNLVPRLIRRSYGSFPSFWSMVPAEYFEDAIEFVYNTPELKQEYAGTIKKARSYQENVMANSRDRLTQLSDEIEISVISKYNVPLMPIFPDCSNTSDGTAETYLTSFGATAADFNKTLSAEYISAMSEEDKKFLSADEKVDASTCVFPEKTWFIKNSYHDHFPDNIDRMIDTILTTDMDVFSNPEYPQFLDAGVNAENLVPVTEKDPEVPEDDSREGLFDMLFRFVKAVIQLFIKIFS